MRLQSAVMRLRGSLKYQTSTWPEGLLLAKRNLNRSDLVVPLSRDEKLRTALGHIDETGSFETRNASYSFISMISYLSHGLHLIHLYAFCKTSSSIAK